MVLSVRDNQRAVVGRESAGPSRVLGKGIQSHIMQKNQPFVMLSYDNATSIALVMTSMAWGTGAFLEVSLTHLSWRDPATKNLGAAADAGLNSLFLAPEGGEAARHVGKGTGSQRSCCVLPTKLHLSVDLPVQVGCEGAGEAQRRTTSLVVDLGHLTGQVEKAGLGWQWRGTESSQRLR